MNIWRVIVLFYIYLKVSQGAGILLGHKSTKTTEIYTHVSRRNLIDIRSPIEDLDLK